MMNMHKIKMDAVKQWFSDFTVPQNNPEHLLKHRLPVPLSKAFDLAR